MRTAEVLTRKPVIKLIDAPGNINGLHPEGQKKISAQPALSGEVGNGTSFRRLADRQSEYILTFGSQLMVNTRDLPDLKKPGPKPTPDAPPPKFCPDPFNPGTVTQDGGGTGPGDEN